MSAAVPTPAFLTTLSLDDPTVTGVGRLPARTPAVPYPDVGSARSGDPAGSPWWRSLDGDWRFALFAAPDELPSDVAAPTFDDDGWSTIAVPGSWTTQPAGGDDRPHYTNVIMPFDLDPPAVPGPNPTGLYRRSIVIPRAWKGRRVVLRLGAAESVAHLWVDGVYVGMGTDSRLPSEFDITAQVRPGRRAAITVAVVKWSAQTWLEDQDQWWHGGIQRSVTLYSTAPSHLADVKLLPGLSGGDTGILDAELRVEGPACREPGWTVELTVETLGGRRMTTTGRLPVPVWDSSSEAAELLSGTFVRPGVVTERLEVSGVSPWSHESPTRYRAVTTLRDPAGEPVEVTPVVTGFRSVEVRDNELLINGAPVLIHGVNLHEHDPVLGRAVDESLTRTDLSLMKANNLNAVRAAHYPHAEHLAELCDELGLYLVDEANVESHGRQLSLCDDPRYATSIVERVERMVRRDKHHPSIIMWSLGNESGYGPPHDAAAAWVRRYDPTRPLHYEGPLMHDLYAAAPVTDVVCPMYTEIADIVSWASSGRDDRRPLILCEYSHAMGNSNGSLVDYWDAFESNHGLQGGFIWEWCEHGLPMPGRAGSGPGGRQVWAYGGDFGDVPNDANFVCDGLVSAARVPHPAMAEVHHVGRPVAVAPDPERLGRLLVTNRRWFSGISDLRARWSISRDGRVIARGELSVPDVQPRSTVEVDVPFDEHLLVPGSEQMLDVVWSIRRRTSWAGSGHVVAHEQFEFAAEADPAGAPGVPAPDRSSGRVESGDSDDADRHGLADLPWTPTIFRALTDNDGIRLGWMRGLVGRLGTWVDHQGIDRCEWIPQEERRRRVDGVTTWTTAGELRAHGVDEPVHVRRRITSMPDGWWRVTVELDVPSALADPPRVGVEWQLPGRFERIEWFGEGPHESYPDRRASTTVGRWATTVSDMYEDYVLPQEHGHREGLRWLALSTETGTEGLLVVVPAAVRGATGFAARHHSDAELWAARHTSDLSDDAAATWLYLDAAQRGVGTGSCGPDALPGYRIGAGRHLVEVAVRHYSPENEDPARLATGFGDAGDSRGAEPS